MSSTPYSLFSVIGIEIEYMIVDKSSLGVKPITDKVLYDYAGKVTNEVEYGPIGISNELVKHVIELKTNGPVPHLDDLDSKFMTQLLDVNEKLKHYNACLMPTGMHPWMNPHTDTQLWNHGYKRIYQAYNKIFDCQGHGWANLQSMHINLPFANDQEFNQLHNAIRLLLPIIPGLTASTPIVDGKRTEYLDTRLSFYKSNQRKLPQITGMLIPEFISTKKMYEQQILNPIYKAIAPFDEKGILQHEWLNSRGAIARFERNAIEIRIVDTQECVRADIACASLIISTLVDIVSNNSLYLHKPIKTELLKEVYDRTIMSGNDTLIDSQEYLKQLGLDPNHPLTVGEIWQYFFERNAAKINPELQKIIQFMLEKDNLATRILKRLDNDYSEQNLHKIYQQLCDCLATNTLFS